MGGLVVGWRKILITLIDRWALESVQPFGTRMRYAVLIFAVLFGILSVVALAGLGWRVLGWSIAGAFQGVLHFSNDPSAPTELSIWSAALVISLFFTVRLTLLYRRNWK